MLEDLCLVAVVGKVTEEEMLTCGKELVVWVEGQLLAGDCVCGGLWGPCCWVAVG